MKSSGLVDVWTLTLSLSTVISETGMQELREKVREVADREASASIFIQPFIWKTRGAVLTVRTQGGPFSLIEIAEWALENCSPEPQGFEVQQSRTPPLAKTEEWQGHGRN